MSASETSREDRELPASERRLRQAREEGQLPRSRDLAHLAGIAALMALAAGLGPWAGRQALGIVQAGLRFDRTAAFETQMLPSRLGHMGLDTLLWLVPLLAGVAVLLAGATLAVGGWNFATQALSPKFERLDPIAGFGRVFGWRSMLQQLKLIPLAAGLLAAGAWYLYSHADELASIARLPLLQALPLGFGWITGGLAILLGVCVLAALVDVPLQLWRHRSELRMTRDEARRENKEDEGDPHLKGERRRRAREMSRGRMLAAVPQANVVVTNPTHYAVALHYDEATMRAPRIVAMGADHLALKIREVAAASGVPLLEAPPLARALYRHGELDAEVPVELYTAVAQVLAWVMRLRTLLRPPPAPRIDVPPGLDPLEAAR